MPGELLNLTRNEQVSGSSPLVGSPKNAHLQVNREDNRFLLAQAGPILIPLRNRRGETPGCRATPVRGAEGLRVLLVESRRAHARHGTEDRTRRLCADAHGRPITMPTP